MTNLAPSSMNRAQNYGSTGAGAITALRALFMNLLRLAVSSKSEKVNHNHPHPVLNSWLVRTTPGASPLTLLLNQDDHRAWQLIPLLPLN